MKIVVSFILLAISSSFSAADEAQVSQGDCYLDGACLGNELTNVYDVSGPDQCLRECQGKE